MTGTRAGMTGGAKGMTERVNIGKDGERPVGKTMGRTVEKTGRGQLERQGGEQWKGRRKAGWKDKGENSGKGEGSPDEGRRKMKEGWNKAG